PQQHGHDQHVPEYVHRETESSEQRQYQHQSDQRNHGHPSLPMGASFVSVHVIPEWSSANPSTLAAWSAVVFQTELERLIALGAGDTVPVRESLDHATEAVQLGVADQALCASEAEWRDAELQVVQLGGDADAQQIAAECPVGVRDERVGKHLGVGDAVG